MRNFPTIAIVGAGLIGQSWANTFARAGSEVRLFDPVNGQAEAALGGIERGLADMKSNGLLDEEVADCLARVSVANSLPDAVEGASYIQESAPEVLEAKRAGNGTGRRSAQIHRRCGAGDLSPRRWR